MPRTTARTPRKRSTVKPTADAIPTAAAPSMHAIAARAYALYCQRGGEHGRDLEDWLQAERELADASAA